MPRPPAHSLSRRERQIMDVLYRVHRSTAADTQAQLPDPPSYSTVRALLDSADGTLDKDRLDELANGSPLCGRKADDSRTDRHQRADDVGARTNRQAPRHLSLHSEQSSSA